MATRYVIEDEPNAADVRALEDALYRYNVQQTGRDDGRWLAIFVRDAEGIVAGVSGWTWAGWLKINNLWVRPERRLEGRGRDLLTAAEAEAKTRGCTRATLETYSFQAPRFYERLGYKIVGTIDEIPAGHKHYFLVKEL